ncbi:GNAT family N-acetyltransferase [Nocardioides nanhaiensis]|uniref:BioF2-like acetyltransferase domain-containing protein n=1 Tax=Nocardioides nanhaiensis TaxID=1476871 RepID=A0ABP8VRT5_9ACTN
MGTARGSHGREPVRVRVHADPEEAWALAAAWERLADDTGAGPFARPDYALTWWEHLGSGALHLVTAWTGDRLVALAPLHRRGRGPAAVLRWLGHGLGTVGEAVVAPGAEEAAGALWRGATARGESLQLVESLEGAPALEPLRAGRRGRSVRASPRDRCPVVDLSAGVEAHLRDPARRRLRRTLSLADRRLAAAGSTFHVETADDPEAVRAVLPAVRHVFDAAEAGRPRQHLLRPPWQGFTEQVLLRASGRGRALVLVGHVDGEPVSFDLALLTARTMHTWVGRFHPDAAAFSPGHLLQRAGLHAAADRGLTRVDLLLGDSAYKRLWATGGYGTCDVVEAPRLLAAGVQRALDLVERRHR